MSTITYSSPSIVTVTRPKRSLPVTVQRILERGSWSDAVIFDQEGADFGHVRALPALIVCSGSSTG
jgi:hypothetical protein